KIYGLPNLSGLPDEVMGNIFKYIRSPSNLLRVNKTWTKLSKRCEVKARGNIDIDQIRKVQQKSAVPWGSDTPLDVFTYIMLEASKRLNPDEFVPYSDLADEKRDKFYKNIIVEAIKPERNINRLEVLNFLGETIGNDCSEFFMDVMKTFEEKNSNYAIEGKISNNDTQPMPSISNHVKSVYKPLSFNFVFYNWILFMFTENSDIASLAFKDILATRISFDLNPDCCKTFEAKFIQSCNIFKVYCNIRNFFLVSDLELLKNVSHEDILCPLFEFYIPNMFGISPTFKMPLKITDDFNVYFKPKRKRKKRIMLKEQKLEWFIAIENIHNDIVERGNSVVMSSKFRNCIEDIYYRLEGVAEELKIELEKRNLPKTNVKKYKIDKDKRSKKILDVR
ncbi:18529_t:CDS:2, partial [Dentiscutata erythropus]